MNARQTMKVAGLLLAGTLASNTGVWAQGQGNPGAAEVAPPASTASPVCHDCGRVRSIRLVEEKGQSSGVGAIAGGVLGGVLGHQIGSGRGNTVATIAGAGAGAYAGNEIEKNRKKKSYWTVALKMDDGRNRTFTYASRPAVNEGDRVKLVDGGRRLALLAQ